MTEADDGRMLRDLLLGGLGISHRLLHQLKFAGSILLNGEAVTVRARVRAGDRILLRLQDANEPRVPPEPLPLSVLYEDEDLLLVDKPAGMIVHPVPPEPSGTLANAIAWHWQQAGAPAPVRVITRLDRDTTGLVLVAKHALAQHYYSTEHRLHKRYLAIVHGALDTATGVIDAPIAVDPENPVCRLVHSTGKPARTAYRTICAGDKASLLTAELLTGRTHQIRVHLSFLGHPIWGDNQYGAGDGFSRQALHCARLDLQHVRTGQQMTFVSPLPTDMHRLCQQLFDDNSLNSDALLAYIPRKA